MSRLFLCALGLSVFVWTAGPKVSLRAEIAAPGPAKQGYHEMVRRVSPALVLVKTNTGLGSGFVFRSDGYILTNHHVIEGAAAIEVNFSDMRRFEARLVGADPESDVALLKITARDLPTVPVGDSSTLEPGEIVVAIGNPHGLTQTVTVGVVSALGRTEESVASGPIYRSFIQTDAAINSGNSGGALINSIGEVIGINTMKRVSQGTEGVAFAIPINQAMGLANQLIETGEIRRARIGIVVEELSFENRTGLKLPDGAYGVNVVELASDGPGEQAGLLVDDVIFKFNGETIRSVGSLKAAAGCQPPGKTVELEVYRGPERRTISLTMGEISSGE